jgi:hypothetical protein
MDANFQGDCVITYDKQTTGAELAAERRATPAQDHHLVAILPRGEAIRNFVYSGALDQIAENVKVTVLSVMPNDEIRGVLESRYGAAYELPQVPERRLVGTVREILDTAHGRWLWSEAAQSRWQVRDLESRRTPALRLKRAAKKAISCSFAHRPGLRLLSLVERSCSKWLSTADNIVDLLRGLNPTLVFNASHIHSGIAVQTVQAAQWLGIPTATFLFSWDNLTSQGRIIPSYDHYLVWSDRIKQDLLDIYPGVIRPEQVFVTGTPQFDFHFRPEFWWSREEFCSRVGADPARPIVLYSTGMANPMLGEPRIVEGIAGMLREMPHPTPQLLVRVYPKDRTGRFDDLKHRCPDVLFPVVPWEPSWLTPLPGDTQLLTNTLRHSDVGINVASTISLELCMLERPVINVAYNPPGIDIHPFDYRRFYEFDHYKPVAQSGAVMLAHSEDAMKGLIQKALAAPSLSVDRQRDLIGRMFGTTLDGRSSHRVAECLQMLASRTHAASSTARRDRVAG